MFGFHIRELQVVRKTKGQPETILWRKVKEQGNVWLFDQITGLYAPVYERWRCHSYVAALLEDIELKPPHQDSVILCFRVLIRGLF